MPWMCLERCGANSSDIARSLQEIEDHLALLPAVSFEMFNLGPNSTLVLNNLTRVNQQLSAMGVETYPMISSWPYPKAFIDWMRQLFANPEPFIAAAVAQAQLNNFSGFNVDFEPTVTATAEDAINYAAFLTTFADALHAQGKRLTVDVALWNPIWNYTLLSQSSVDRVMIMGTYAVNDTIFMEQFMAAYSSIALSKLGIGLETDNANYSQADLSLRFEALTKFGIQELDLWRMDIPDPWWPFIRSFVQNGAC